VQQGVFSVELGGTANPFPLGLYEQPLWMSLEVGSDGEMSPRRPITSTGFAFKADDANTLEGVSASTLDQSAHVSDTANPHNVTAAQVGAADAGTLASHISNTSNPHSVTAAQTGAASSVDFTKHTLNSAAHHLRYTDIEAIAAMGVKKDTNALNHDKYSNSNAVAAILAADGAGSSLDADLVDGLQASEIIDAAQDEVRTPISSLPYTISQSGSYYLTGNLDGSTGGIDITADKVTLDLMGFTIDGGGTVTDYGIDFSGRSSINIRNGFITNFGFGGIYQNNSVSRYAKVVDVQVLGNGTLGVVYSGIYLAGGHSLVERCIAGSNGGIGIYVSANSKLINNTAYKNAGSYGIAGDYNSILSGNSVYNNTGSYGIFGGDGAILSGNTAYANSIGIYGGYGSILSGNTVYGSSGNYGIYANSGSTVSNNAVYSNSNWGIYAVSSNTIKDNTIYVNNNSGSAGLGGLRVGNDSRVAGNTLDSNSQNNIYVTSTDNTIENNLVTDSTNGIFFNSSGNFYGNNRASGNTTNFNLNGTAQSTSTYLPNISF
jgi:parallel beta-helix repeat protein